ncbi:hypothetical protein D9M73_280640 [compost metagenome]
MIADDLPDCTLESIVLLIAHQLARVLPFDLGRVNRIDRHVLDAHQLGITVVTLKPLK